MDWRGRGAENEDKDEGGAENAEKLEKWLDERPARGAPQEPEQI